MNPTVEPCTDFFEYANGGWRAANPDPGLDAPLEPPLGGGRVQQGPAQGDPGRGLDRVRSPEKGGIDQLIGDFYGACMDMGQRNAARGQAAPAAARGDRRHEERRRTSSA